MACRPLLKGPLTPLADPLIETRAQQAVEISRIFGVPTYMLRAGHTLVDLRRRIALAEARVTAELTERFRAWLAEHQDPKS